MDFKKYLNKANILIFVCSLVILGLFLFIIYNLIEAYTNTTLTQDIILTASSTCASLIVALISIIAIVIILNLLKNQSARLMRILKKTGDIIKKLLTKLID